MIKKRQLYYLYAFLACFLFLDAVLPLFAYHQAQLSGDEINNSLYQLAAVFLYITSFVLLFKHRNETLELLNMNKLVVAILLITFVSTIWSIERVTTLKSAIALLGTTSVAFLLIQRIAMRDFMKILIFTLFVTNLLSVFFSISFQDMSVHQYFPHEGYWKGVYSHKNILARNTSLAVVVSVIYYFEFSRKTFFATLYFILAISVSLFLLLMSGGKTGFIIALFLVILVYPLVKFIKSASFSSAFLANALYFGGAFFLVSLLYLGLNAESLLATLGGNLTLSGRTFLWVFLLDYLKKGAFIGYGFDAFWASEYAVQLGQQANWDKPPPHAHNAFLDLILNFGILGAVPFIILYIKSIFASLRSALKYKEALISVIILGYLTIYTIPGSLILSQNSISWILFLFIVTYISDNEKQDQNTVC